MKTFLRWFTLFFIFALPIGTKKFVAVLLPRFFENAREFSSLFIYGTDIIAALIIIFAIIHFRRALLEEFAGSKILPLFVGLAALSVMGAANHGYAAYVFGGLLVGALIALVVGVMLRTDTIRFRDAATAIGLSAFFQAVVALLQFYYQKSIGLWFLGESVITATTPGVARVLIGGERYLRSYGTLPHANILAGFLILGIIAIVYLFFTSAPEKKGSRIFSAVGFFVILSALILTFSRSGWIIGGGSIVAILAYGIMRKELRPRAFEFLGIALISLLLLAYSLGWAIVPRAGFVKGEASVDHRIFYNEIGLSLLEKHPLGVGEGNQVLQAEREGLYLLKGLNEVWLWQPVHNIYILIASELGIPGLLLFLLFLFVLFKEMEFKRTQAVFASLLVISLLAFGLVDHFPWDLHAGRLMFWVALGIMMGEQV